ncbi:MAG TPA: hypothetical protein EYP55_09635 [Anaerolineae bacterium]|nr:hypothetical protein [Anaerolineae bacterium]
MKKWMLLLLAVLVVASLGFASVANAETEKGTGTLEARGDGLAGLHGTGWVRISGNGVLWVKGAENVVVEGRGHKKVFPDGWIEYVGFKGTARIRGGNFSVILAGERIDLYAVGSGRAILWGKGTYEVNGLITNVWPGTIETVSY